MAKKKNATVDFQKVKENVALQKFYEKFRIPLAILLIILIGLGIFFAQNETKRSNIQDSFRSFPVNLQEPVGFPYSEAETSLDHLELIGDKPLLVTNNGIKVLSQNANVLNELFLNQSGLKAVSNNGRALIFSNTTSKAMLISRTVTLANFSEGGPIVNGCVGKNGSVALTYPVEGATSEVKVYDNSQKVQFVWDCSQEYIGALALSDNGKKVLLSAVGTKNAELYSRVILFKTNKEKPEFDIKLEGTAILKVIYSSSGKIIAVGDNTTVILNSKGEIVNKLTYADDALFYIDKDTSGNTLLCYKEFGGSKLKVITIPKYGKSFKEFELKYIPSSADIRSGKIAFSLDDQVTLYSKSGNEKKKYECAHTVSKVLLTSTGIFTLESGSICFYS